METHIVSGLTAYGAGYISEADKDLDHRKRQGESQKTFHGFHRFPSFVV